MSGLIRQRLSAVETDLRRAITELNTDWADRSISEIIDAMVGAELCHHPLYEKLNRLDAAQCQLDLGLYGMCADCESEIEPERLAQDPTEQRCQCCSEQYAHEHRRELRLSH
ncbi:TraR/DksA family transcriptional regulator [Shewanella yunxiaonensis]|uniref:TraR/DksA family transcriptional regulator n=1 Tax=Shewanella yunxiaonensis TaxID=2829809 RepID=A0ABX7YW84_9GAMM|nr:TraR/DksA family transcriptional regulator [Shewanella yunxiaonensis]QUN07029.1 TraR/DksA family transcriptional regulator [Shewanella yunxiaonensis]